MFKRLFKKSTESTINTKKVIIPCACDGENEHCDLISQLRKHQDLKNNIQNEIQALDNEGHGLLDNFLSLLTSFERNGLYMGKYDGWMAYDRSVEIVKNTINQHSSADIFRRAEELKTYRHKTDIINEKKRALKVVEDDIKNIKSKLGIE